MVQRDSVDKTCDDGVVGAMIQRRNRATINTRLGAGNWLLSLLVSSLSLAIRGLVVLPCR